ncbi:MAG: GntR family transcriptional regulator [Deltaproteobacteria bacterium]|nr:MAG: GntR family transcriptional regulator [Deltaproteobacteria bacterium]RLB03253.1 MAG: GntR family transcriptional regulator [Deltaproteobacteria bacterium]
MDEKLVREISFEERMPLWERIYRRLRGAIQRGEFDPGTRLVEQRLAEELGVSRTPVREALYRLEREGLVTKVPHKGIVVREQDPEELKEVLELRGLLEGYAAALAAKKGDEELFDELEEILKRSEEALEKNDIDELVKLNTQFHETLYRRCGNHKLLELIKDLRDQFFRFRTSILRIKGMPRVSIEDHYKMLELMRKGESQAVEKLVREHIGRGKERLLREIKR